MKVRNMLSPRTGKPVPNQFIIEDKKEGCVLEEFQSYKTTIARVEHRCKERKILTFLDEDYWNYSRTTAKYRNLFLGETTKETQSKIDSGEYILKNLN